MDEAAVEKAGAAPLEAELDAIAALKRVADLPPLLARLHLASAQSSPLFGFGSSQDYADSNRVIAFAYAGGLGLPDRDYYVKTDAKSQETRATLRGARGADVPAAGRSAAAAAKAEAQTVMEIETALAKASLTRVEKRDPYKLFHKMTRAELLKLTPAFDWAAYWNALGLPAPTEINVTEPAFYQEVERQLQTRGIADWKAYLRWHLVHDRGGVSFHGLRAGEFRFLSASTCAA